MWCKLSYSLILFWDRCLTPNWRIFHTTAVVRRNRTEPKETTTIPMLLGDRLNSKPDWIGLELTAMEVSWVIIRPWRANMEQNPTHLQNSSTSRFSLNRWSLLQIGLERHRCIVVWLRFHLRRIWSTCQAAFNTIKGKEYIYTNYDLNEWATQTVWNFIFGKFNF